MFKEKIFRVYFLIFILINILFFSFTTFFHSQIPFQEDIYASKSSHYISDERFNGGPFNLLLALSGWDGQFYLRIAESGYETINGIDKLSYAFFPLYPLIIAGIHIIVRDVSLSAFLLTNILLVLNFVSIYYIVSKWFSKKTAWKTILLLFLLPFSVFYRYYFPESLFLLLLLWFSYFFIKRDWDIATVVLALLIITKPNGLFILPVYLFFLVKDIKAKKIPLTKSIILALTLLIPFFLWLQYNLIYTDNALYWSSIQSVWYTPKWPLETLWLNVKTLFSFLSLPFHSWHSSKVDALSVFAMFFLLFKSRKFLRKELWLISLSLCVMPLLLKDTMSYSRYAIVVFPLYIYLAEKIPAKLFWILSVFLFALLVTTSVYFVNWYWVG